MEFPVLKACLPEYLVVDVDIIMPSCTVVFDTFHRLSSGVFSSLIRKFSLLIKQVTSVKLIY